VFGGHHAPEVDEMRLHNKSGAECKQINIKGLELRIVELESLLRDRSR
jgi:hypothetical protein